MLKISIISFPGLGIPEFNVNSVAFTLFGREIAWYGVIITLGMILAVSYVMFRAKQNGISPDTILDLAIYSILFGILGARLYYVLTSLDSYDSFWDAFKLWEGGLGIYGGIIAGLITVYAFCRIKKYNFLLFGDMICPAVMIGQMLGRYGNFMNAEAYGAETTLPWRMGIRHTYFGIPYGETIYVHPTFFYESLWNFIGVILVNILYRKKKFDGQIFYICFAWYGFGRMFIELLRSDSLYICSYHAWWTKISVIVGFSCFAIFTTLLVINFVKTRKIDSIEENNTL